MLVVVLLSMLLLAGVAAAVTMTATSELSIAASYGGGRETLYAAEAGVERAVVDLAATADWDRIWDGTARSTFLDEPAGGPMLADGSSLDVAGVVANASAGSAGPGWRLYGSGWLTEIAPAEHARSPCYVVVMVAPDPVHAGAILVRAAAFGARAARRSVQVCLARADVAGFTRLASWQEVRR